MSASFSQKNKVQAKPFCKVCHDSGKTEAEYTSHFVKSEPGFKGKVVCPTLLSQPCTYCHVAGHTVSYCETLKQHNKNKEKTQRASVFQKETTPVVKKNHLHMIKKRGFAALGELDEAMEAQEEAYQVAYPSIGQGAKTQNKAASVISYASMTAKAPIKMPEIKAPEIKIITKAEFMKKSWADWSDSDSDDEEDEDCECGHCDF